MTIRRKGPKERDRPSTPVATGPLFTQLELSSMVDVVFGPTTAPEHPRNIATVADAAETAMQLWEILRIVTDPSRDTPADEVVRAQVFSGLEPEGRIHSGETETEAAIRIFGTAFITSLTRLTELARGGEAETSPTFGRYGATLGEVLRTIRTAGSSGLRGDELRLHEFMTGPFARRATAAAVAVLTPQPASSVVPARVGNEDALQVPVEEDVQLAGARAPIYMPQQVLGLGTGHFLSSGGRLPFLAFGDAPGYETQSLFGGSGHVDEAQGLVNAFAAFGAAYVEDMLQESHMTDLLDYLDRLQELNPDFQNDTNYQALRTALADSNAARAIEIIDQMRETGSPLASAIAESGHRYILRLSEEGITVLRLGEFRVEIDFNTSGERNWDTFTRLMQEGNPEAFGFRALYFAISLAYDMVYSTATVQEALNNEPVGQPQRVEGLAHLGVLNVQLGLGTHFGRQPVEIIVHASGSLGSQAFEPISVGDAHGTQMMMGDQLNANAVPRLDFYGIEVRFHYPEERTFRFERFGLAGTGIQMQSGPSGLEYDPNMLGYATASLNAPLHSRANDTAPRREVGRFRFGMTPIVGYLLDHWRAGGDVNADFMVRFRRHILTLGTGIRVQYRFPGNSGNTAMRPTDETGIWQIEPTYIRAGYQPYPGVEITLGLGGRFDVEHGSGRLTDMNQPIVGQLGLTLRPGTIRRARGGEGQQVTDTLAVVPQRGILNLGQEVWEQYIAATTFVRENEGHLSEPDVRQQAQEHARLLREAILGRIIALRAQGDDGARAANTVARGSSYRYGMRHLEGGRLDQALEVLRRIPAFSVITETNTQPGSAEEDAYLQRRMPPISQPANQEQDQEQPQHRDGAGDSGGAPPVETGDGSSGPSARRGRRPTARPARRATGNPQRRRRRS